MSLRYTAAAAKHSTRLTGQTIVAALVLLSKAAAADRGAWPTERLVCMVGMLRLAVRAA